jgi:2-keto-3-deoxy-L-rhamnonate aldolase RhmA
MSPTTLRERIHAGETTFGAWLGLGSPLGAELLGRAGFDWVVVDLSTAQPPNPSSWRI